MCMQGDGLITPLLPLNGMVHLVENLAGHLKILTDFHRPKH